MAGPQGIAVEIAVDDAPSAQVRDQDFAFLTDPIEARPLETQSGDLQRSLGALPGQSRVRAVDLIVEGATFHGKLEDLRGVAVYEGPAVYATNGEPGDATSTALSYVVDFGRPLTVIRLRMIETSAKITMVVPGMGMDFSPKTAYPVPGAYELGPRSDSTGATTVTLAAVETSKLLIQLSGSSLPLLGQFASVCRVTTGTFPSNVQASLNGRLPFWTHPGPLDGEATPTGLAEDLTALLAQASGDVDVTLTLATDAPGVLRVAPDPLEVEVERLAAARWGGQPSTQVPLAALEPATVPVPFPAEGSAPWEVGEIEVDLSGDFPPWRAFSGQDTAIPGKVGMRVTAGLAVARRVESTQAAEVFGVALPLRPGAEAAQLRLELVGEEADAPGGGSPLAAVDLELAAPAGSSSAPALTWLDVVFASPVQIPAQIGHWLVVKAKTGQVEWAGAPEPGAAATRTLFASEGGRWERHPLVDGAPPVAQIRLLRRPFAEDNESLLTLAWAGADGEAVGAEPGVDGTTVAVTRPDAAAPTLMPAEGSVTVPLVVTARATGVLTVRGATAAYTETGA